jgi:hypothetical protein
VWTALQIQSGRDRACPLLQPPASLHTSPLSAHMFSAVHSASRLVSPKLPCLVNNKQASTVKSEVTKMGLKREAK